MVAEGPEGLEKNWGSEATVKVVHMAQSAAAMAVSLVAMLRLPEQKAMAVL
jgi:hypothetical protein